MTVMSASNSHGLLMTRIYKFLRPALLGCLTLFQLASSLSAQLAASSNGQPPEINVKPKSNVVFADGDPRFTDSGGCVSDSAYRRALVDGMAHAPEKPDFLIMTGDVAYRGDDDNDWRVFDDETKPLKDEKIPIFPVLGNHDLHGTTGQTKFMDHFDQLKSHSQLKTQGWYLMNYGNAEFLMLDSEKPYDEHSPQGDWIRSKLKSVPEELSFLFVVLHHPLVSHPSGMPSIHHCGGGLSNPAMGHEVEHSEKRLNSLLEDFSKTHPSVRLIVLAGHNHNYERYVVNGITYIVTAGGGATPYMVDRHSSDAYRERGPTFHYCRFTFHGNSLTGEMYKLTLDSGTPHWEQKDRFELTTPVAAEQVPNKP